MTYIIPAHILADFERTIRAKVAKEEATKRSMIAKAAWERRRAKVAQP